MAGQRGWARRGLVWAAQFAALCALVLTPNLALAQLAAPSPSQVTPQNIAPPPPAPPPPLAISGVAAAKAPPGADKIHVTIGGVVADGGFAELAAETSSVAAPFIGKSRSIADLYDLAAAIEAAYTRAGFILARVVVPPQPLKDGEDFHVKIIDGYFETVDVSHVPAALAGPVAARLSGLVGLHHANIRQVERALTLAGTLPGIKLRSTLAPGKEEGGTRLVIEADYSPFAGSLSADNKLGPLFNDWEMNLQLSANSLLGFGEQIYAYVSGSPELARAFGADAKRRVAGAGMSLPVGDDGLTASIEGTIADTKPFVNGAFFQSDGLFKRLDTKFSYPVLKSRSESLTLGGTFEYSVQTEVADGFGVVVDEDRLNVLRLSLDWNKTFDESSLDIFGQASKGVTWLNVRTLSDVVATGAGFSRFGASPNFGKLEARIAFNRSGLPYGMAASVQVRGQLRLNDAMPSSELFSLDGDDAISPLVSGAVSGDDGAVARLELQRPTLWGPFQFTPYLFDAAGQVFDKYETPGEVVRSAAYGAGLRASYAPVYGLAPTLSVEAGHDSAGQAGGNRITINLGVSF